MQKFEVQCNKCGSDDVSLAIKQVSANGKNLAVAIYCNDCELEEYITDKEENLFDDVPLVELAEHVFDLGEI